MIMGCKSNKKKRIVSYKEGSALIKELEYKFSKVSTKNY